MTAQVRTIVALTGERLVVMPEADYEALLVAAREMETRPRAEATAKSAKALSPEIAKPSAPSVTLEQVLLRA